MVKDRKSRFVSLALAVLFVLVLGLQVPCYAAYNSSSSPQRVLASDHVSSVVVSGDTKLITYSFPSTSHWINVWSSPSGIKNFSMYLPTNNLYTPNFTGSEAAQDNSFSSRVYHFGSETYDGQPCPVGALDISDIMPGADLDLTLSFQLHFNYREGAVKSASVTMSAGAFCYDSSGKYIKTVFFPENAVTVNLLSTEIEVEKTITYDPDCTLSVGSDVALIVPYTAYSFKILDPGVTLNACFVSYRPLPFEMSVPINMVYENSQTMEAVKDQLGDINSGIQDTNDKLDQTNDKLDQIISGGEKGDALVDAGNALEGSSSQVSGSVDSFTNDISGVQDFESDMREELVDNLDKIDVIKGVGNFNASLAFVSGYVEDIFYSLSEWQVAITLPLFLGLFFGVCQHVGGISHLRIAAERRERMARLRSHKGG